MADQTQVGGHGFEIGAERVDVEAAAAGIAGIDGQLLRLAIVLEVDKDPLDALLVELVVLAERDEIAQQLLPIEFRPLVADHHRAPVGLAGDQTVGFEQVAVQGLFYLFATGCPLQQGRIKLVIVYLDILLVDALAGQQGNLVWRLVEGEQGHLDGLTGTGTQILGQHGGDCLDRVATGLVEGVEVELEGFGFDQVRTGGRNGHFPHRHHRLALGVEPGELIEGPDIATAKGQIIAQLEIIPVQATWNRLQQGGGVLADVIGLLAQAQAGQGAGPGVSILFAHRVAHVMCS